MIKPHSNVRLCMIKLRSKVWLYRIKPRGKVRLYKGNKPSSKVMLNEAKLSSKVRLYEAEFFPGWRWPPATRTGLPGWAASSRSGPRLPRRRRRRRDRGRSPAKTGSAGCRSPLVGLKDIIAKKKLKVANVAKVLPEKSQRSCLKSRKKSQSLG